MALIEWLDYSSQARDSILDSLAVQQEKGTLDELGIGSVRDAIADHLFPPLNTIQTRAKYFLFVPWIYRALEGSSVNGDLLQHRAEQRERKLIEALVNSPSPDKAGLIGKESHRKQKNLKRLPSSIYWSGIRRLGIFQDESSLAEYVHELSDIRSFRRQRRTVMEQSEEPESSDGGLSWDTGLPKAEPDFLDTSGFELDPLQAIYLKQKTLGMKTETGRICLLQWMVLHADVAELDELPVPWGLLAPGARPNLPDHLTRELVHARNFSVCMRVLTALYYRFLSEERRDLNTEAYDLVLADACHGAVELAEELLEWHGQLGAFWQWVSMANPRLSRDRPFIDRWLNELSKTRFSPGEPRCLTTADMRRFLQVRERALKRGLARLGNPAVVARWNAPTSAALLDYRWGTARHFVRDVRRGLRDTGGANAGA